VQRPAAIVFAHRWASGRTACPPATPISTGRSTVNLTPKQLKILQLIRDHRVRTGCSPTMQELADELGVSKVTVFEHVEALIRKGALTREPNKARSLSISENVALPDEEKPMTFPLVGKIAAGYPIEKTADSDELDLASLFGPRVGQVNSSFALRVDGDSMKDEGILDGDYVIIERRETARNGDRVVALLPNGETTLKTFFREPDHIRLQPANPDFEPIRVNDCQIQGIVLGVLRRYE
jgi:repressor LexA